MLDDIKKFIEFCLDDIRFFFFRRRMLRVKRQVRLEGLMDKYFIEDMYKDTLTYDDSEDRKALAAAMQKEEKDRDPVAIQKLQEKIGDGKAIKQTYRKTLVMLEELNEYIEAIKKCKNLN